jgi:hypothetical protein
MRTVKHTAKFRKKAKINEIAGKHAVKSNQNRYTVKNEKINCTFSS